MFTLMICKMLAINPMESPWSIVLLPLWGAIIMTAWQFFAYMTIILNNLIKKHKNEKVNSGQN